MNEILSPIFIIVIACLFNLPLFLDFFNNKNKDPEETILKIIIFFGGLFASFAFSMFLLMPIEFASNTNNTTVLFVYPFIILPYLIIRLIAFIVNYLKVVTSKHTDIYVRDVFVDYSPAVLSLLLNHKIEDKKDFDATILNIHAKNVIEFKKVDDKLEIVDLQNTKPITTLTEDERYIYNILLQKEKFDKHKWHSIIKAQLDIRNFVKRGNKNILWQIIKISLIMFAILFLLLMLFVLAVFFIPGDFFTDIAMNHFNYDVILSILWILILIPFQLGTLNIIMLLNKRNYLKDKMDYYTEKGALEMLKWKKFKAFIQDYSMIDTANLESVVLWEKYIAYSMALNINKSYNSAELKKINETIQNINFHTLNIFF